MGELKPCPFCGGEKLNHKRGDFIGCLNINCGGMVEMGSPWGGPEEDGIAWLIAAWNRRPDPSGVVEALKWYAEQVEGCRKLGSIGEPFRNALDADGGKRALAALRSSATVQKS